MLSYKHLFTLGFLANFEISTEKIKLEKNPDNIFGFFEIFGKLKKELSKISIKKPFSSYTFWINLIRALS